MARAMGPSPTNEFDYDTIARQYDRHRRVGGPFIAPLARLAHDVGARRVLELGPGTGNSARGFLDAWPCELVALEQSAGMIAHARSKTIPGRWVRGDARELPFRDASFDMVFAVLVLQHIPEADAVIRECRRIVGDGCAAFVTAPRDFIEHHPLRPYFPSFSRIDLERFQPEGDLLELMQSEGFAETGLIAVEAEPQPIDAAYLEKIANKFISTFHLIPDAEFQSGLAALRAEIERKGRLDEDMVWRSVVVWGRTRHAARNGSA